MEPLQPIAPGINAWRAAHPEWHTTTELVASYALDLDEGLVIVDPLLPGGDDGAAVLDELRDLAADRPVLVYVTIPYHVRDSEQVAQELRARIWSHPAVAKRIDDTSLLEDATASGATLPFGLEALRIGNPTRYEHPLHAPGVRALVVGDAIVGVRGGLRLWEAKSDGGWYRERFVPSVAHLAELDVDHVLVTHGEPVLDTGAAALRTMLDEAPVASLRGEIAGAALPH